MHWRLSAILKISKKVHEVIFFDMYMYILKMYSTHYALKWNTQMLKKFRSDKINGIKNALFFLLRAPTHHSFIFNL